MNRTIKIILINIAGFVAAGNTQTLDNRQVLDKMYNDIIKSLPASQRALIDSTYASSHKEQLNGNTGASLKADAGNAQDINLPDAVNSDLIKMMQQVDTMRHKRMIHFKSTNVPVE